MNHRRRQNDAALRFAKRRQREDDAPRLLDAVPNLTSLKLELDERPHAETAPALRHTRHIVVDRAPAVFFIVCGERGCTDGGHDLTRDVIRELERSSKSFSGEHECDGLRDGSRCRNTLRYRVLASYAT